MAWGRTERPKLARWQKATAIIPLALLAGAWTANLESSSTANADARGNDPGIPAVPTTQIDQPANYNAPSSPGVTSHGDRPALDPSNPSSASATGIPTAAMSAYHRAATVLAQADPSCHLSWALVAAIGRVESDHGRYGGSVLGPDGNATPGIYGLPLDGSHSTARVADTDGGAYDHDTDFDRAVGPMQFIPGTWDIVGVDGDGDGVKDPQDIDDAALGTAVYLCAGTQDLSTTEGQRAAVFSYNHSQQYVALVLAIMNAYLDGNFTQVADGLPASMVIPLRPTPHHTVRPRHHAQRQHPTRHPGTHTPSANDDDPTAPSRPSKPHQSPGNDKPSPGGDDDQPSGTDPPSSTPAVPTLPDPTTVVEPVVKTLGSLTAATRYCTQHLPGDPTEQMIEACGKKLKGKTLDEAADLLSGGLAHVLARLGLGGLLPVPAPCVLVLCTN